MLARDRIGKKPLYYAHRPDALTFASEPRSVLQDPGVSREPDWAAIDAYLVNQYVPHDRCAFKALAKLPPASTLLWSPGSDPVIERYWRLEYGPKAAISEADAAEQLRHDRGSPLVDVVLDFVGADGTMSQGASALAPGGRLVVIGGAGGSLTVAKGRDLPLGWHVSAPFWGPRHDLEAVVDLARRGLVEAEIEIVRFSETLDAYRRLREGSVHGRLVVVPD
jgi:hypothetical protein